MCCNSQFIYQGIPYLNNEQVVNIIIIVWWHDMLSHYRKRLLAAVTMILGLLMCFVILWKAKRFANDSPSTRLWWLWCFQPLIGHNMLVDLCLVYENFHKSLPGKWFVHVLPNTTLLCTVGSYEEFKHNMHQLFPTIIDTKQMSFQLKKVLR